MLTPKIFCIIECISRDQCIMHKCRTFYVGRFTDVKKTDAIGDLCVNIANLSIYS